MTIGLLFWLLMIIWLVFGATVYWPATPAVRSAWAPFGGNLLLWVLLALLGIAAFGWPIKA